MTGDRPLQRRWSVTGRILHWLSAAAILTMLALGFVMVELTTDPARRFDLTQMHKTGGALVFMLTLVRLAWRLGARRPPLPATMARGEILASRLMHGLIYLSLFAMLGSGYVMVSASTLPLPVHLPGGLVVPNLTGVDDDLSRAMLRLHHGLALWLCGLIALHVAAALWHALVRRDGVLQSMLPGRSRRQPAATPRRQA